MEKTGGLNETGAFGGRGSEGSRQEPFAPPAQSAYKACE